MQSAVIRISYHGLQVEDHDDNDEEGEEEDPLAKMVSFNDDVLIRGRIYL